MTRSGSGRLRAVVAVLSGVLLVAGLSVLWPVQLGGRTTYVTTHGISMMPTFHTGDLAVVRPSGSYRVGDVVAYRSRIFKTTVLHRIVGVDSAGRYTFKGDNNSWLDTEQPGASDLVGRLAVRVPQGGVWVKRATGPAALAVLAVTLLAGGGRAVHTRRRKRRTMSRHAARRSRSSRWTAPRQRTAAAATACLAVAGAGLGLVTWTVPVDTQATKVQHANRSMTFSYVATVPRTPAYDGTTVTPPDPVFRRLASTVDVRFSYQGGPGSIAVNAVLTTASGWHATFPLAAPKAFTDSRYDGTARLDLAALERRAQAAAAVTGLPADQLVVAVTPQVTGADGTSFAPTLRLALDRFALKLADDVKALTATDSTEVRRTALVPRTLSVLGRTFRVADGRVLSEVLLLAALLAGMTALVLRRFAPASESAAIHSRYAQLLVPVHPMPAPAGRPVVDVTAFATLVRLAERYGLLVLHWTRSDVETFLVQDDGTTYRYRTGAAVAEPSRDSADASVTI